MIFRCGKIICIRSGGSAMTLNDLKAIIKWVRSNGRNRISDEDRAWAKAEIDRAVTYKDLAKAVIGYLNTSKS